MCVANMALITHCISVVVYWNPHPRGGRIDKRLNPTSPIPLVRLEMIQLHPQSKQSPLRLKWWELWNIVSISFYLIFKTMTHNWCAWQMATMTHCIFGYTSNGVGVEIWKFVYLKSGNWLVIIKRSVSSFWNSKSYLMQHYFRDFWDFVIFAKFWILDFCLWRPFWLMWAM
jgi:hypothetical protein